MRQRVSLHRQTPGVDAVLGQYNTYPVVANNLACNVQPVKAEEQVYSDKYQQKLSHKIYFINDPGIQEGDAILFNGEYYITLPPQDQISRGLLYEVDAYIWKNI